MFFYYFVIFHQNKILPSPSPGASDRQL